jgi:hypothetical protein
LREELISRLSVSIYARVLDPIMEILEIGVWIGFEIRKGGDPGWRPNVKILPFKDYRVTLPYHQLHVNYTLFYIIKSLYGHNFLSN